MIEPLCFFSFLHLSWRGGAKTLSSIVFFYILVFLAYCRFSTRWVSASRTILVLFSLSPIYFTPLGCFLPGIMGEDEKRKRLGKVFWLLNTKKKRIGRGGVRPGVGKSLCMKRMAYSLRVGAREGAAVWDTFLGLVFRVAGFRCVIFLLAVYYYPPFSVWIWCIVLSPNQLSSCCLFLFSLESNIYVCYLSGKRLYFLSE